MEPLDISTANCQIERDTHTLVITLDRPEARNALNSSMLVGLYKAWRMLDATPSLYCAVLTGTGSTFCSGMDLKQGPGNDSDETIQQLLKTVPDLHWQAMLKCNRPHKPIILAVEGYALAGGMEVALGTDIRVCGKSAQFGIPETRRGLFPLGGSTARLRRQIPYVLAAEALILGHNITAVEALRWGVVNRVVEDGDALAEALSIADEVSRLAPLSVRATVKSLRENQDMTEAEAIAAEEQVGWTILASKDAKEGMKAFKEKRIPQFAGE